MPWQWSGACRQSSVHSAWSERGGSRGVASQAAGRDTNQLAKGRDRCVHWRRECHAISEQGQPRFVALTATRATRACRSRMQQRGSDKPQGAGCHSRFKFRPPFFGRAYILWRRAPAGGCAVFHPLTWHGGIGARCQHRTRLRQHPERVGRVFGLDRKLSSRQVAARSLEGP